MSAPLHSSPPSNLRSPNAPAPSTMSAPLHSLLPSDLRFPNTHAASTMSAPLHISPPSDLPLDDLLLEVFLRHPPEPHHLLAASLVCRRWRRLVRNHAFLRRFRAFHRTPPVLGFFQNLWSRRVSRDSTIHQRRLVFASVSSSIGSLIPPKPDHWVLDCRCGRVLLHGSGEQGLLVWVPMAGGARQVRTPPGSLGLEVAAVMLCAARHNDHTDCRSASFQIVFLDCSIDGNDENHDWRLISAYVYSSETAAWGDATAIKSPLPVDMVASAVAGSSVYWNLELTTIDRNYILEFEMSRQRLALIELPRCVCQDYMSDIHVMMAEDGGIGFACLNGSNLHFWSRRIVPEGEPEWLLIRSIELNNFTMPGLPARDLFWSSVAAFSEDGDEVFLQSDAGIFVINIRSLQLRKVFEATGLPLYPYSSFYTRGRDIVGIDDRDEQ